MSKVAITTGVHHSTAADSLVLPLCGGPRAPRTNGKALSSALLFPASSGSVDWFKFGGMEICKTRFADGNDREQGRMKEPRFSLLLVLPPSPSL